MKDLNSFCLYTLLYTLKIMKLYTILLLGTVIWFANAVRTHELLDIAITILFAVMLFGYSHYKDVMNE